MEETTIKQVSRRNLLKTSAVVGAAAAAGFAGIFGNGTTAFAAHDKQDSVQTIINLAATAELLAVTTYYTALTAGDLQLTGAERRFLTAALDSELTHFEVLVSLGATPAATSFFTVNGMFSNRATFVAVLDTAETLFIGAYVAASRRFAELGAPNFSAVATQTAVVEGQHHALIRQMQPDLLPNNNSYAQPIFYNVSDVVPSATPFLSGGSGFSGPTAAPSAATVRALVGQGGTRKVPLMGFGAW
jgi:hypothetical protein